MVQILPSHRASTRTRYKLVLESFFEMNSRDCFDFLTWEKKK